jgi:hypothetical protein
MSEHEHEEEAEGLGESIESALEMDTQTQIFLEMRQQNLELLRLCAEVAGFTGPHPAVKPADLKVALRSIWEVYSEFYAWIDPEESEGDDEEDEEEDDQ